MPGGGPIPPTPVPPAATSLALIASRRYTMVYTLQRAEEMVIRSLGLTGQQPHVGTTREIINSTLTWLENCRAWRFLEEGQTTLDLIKDQPFVLLPSNVRNITGYSATRALINTFEPTTQHEIIRLRAQRTVTSQLHFWGALEYIAPGLTNLFVRTEDFSDAEWVTLPGGDVVQVVTKNHATSPDSEEQTATRLLVNATGGNLKWVGQEAHYSALSAGEYVVSVKLKKDSTPPHTTDLSKIRLLVPGGTSQVTGHVDWSATPPTFTIIPGETTGSLTAVGSEVGADGWIRVWLSFAYAVAEGEGKMQLRIFPVQLSSATGSILAFGAQFERTLKSRFSEIASTSSVDPTTYEAVLGSEQTIQAPPRPALGLWPAPSANSTGTLSITYTKQIPRVGNDTDFIQIPEWMDMLFVDALQRCARGWEEFDVGGFAERLEPLRNSRLFDDCEDRDSDMMPSLGPMNAGHVTTRGGWINWDTGRASALP